MSIGTKTYLKDDSNRDDPKIESLKGDHEGYMEIEIHDKLLLK